MASLCEVIWTFMLRGMPTSTTKVQTPNWSICRSNIGFEPMVITGYIPLCNARSGTACDTHATQNAGTSGPPKGADPSLPPFLGILRFFRASDQGAVPSPRGQKERG